ncbi:PulJ/GspJ family protein [Novipirellula sp. SH528]|uniref:PulJ/GspJ family protein n=1 Tax=Novipirellula sp. SH528 TaxID=3454466 RepID=UPI003FA1237E
MRYSKTGHTLIELVVSMAAGGTLMALAMGLVHQSMTWSTIGNSRAAHDRECQRMVDQFRSDVHRCDQVVRGESVYQLLRGDWLSVIYKTEANQITRTEADEGNTVRLETYTLAKSYTASFDYSESKNEASLAIRFDTDSYGYESRIDRHAIAKLGRLLQRRNPNSADRETRKEEATP